jgi:hypothetical protein
VSTPRRLQKILAGSKPPAPDEIEVSLFGPGYGESLAVHLGQGRWMIVDSCVDHETGSPAALDYLDSIGVDCASSVVAVLATHWHDDHIRGLTQVIERCELARFACSSALQSRELLELVSAQVGGTRRLSSGTREFRNVVLIVRDRRAKGTLTGGSVSLLTEHTIVDRSATSEVIALSPSSISTEYAIRAIADLLPERVRPQHRVVAPNQNAASVALWIGSSHHAALLGADLQAESDDDRGWGAVLARDPARTRRAALVKIPHHGAASAHDQRMWDDLLEPGSDAILTPWRRGAARLPSDDDCTRICGLAGTAAIAGQSEMRAPRYDGAVERTLREVAISRRSAVGRMGHVRARCGPSNADRWRVDLVAHARSLCAAA